MNHHLIWEEELYDMNGKYGLVLDEEQKQLLREFNRTLLSKQREEVVKTESVVEHTHNFSRGKKPQCKICGLYQHMLKIN